MTEKRKDDLMIVLIAILLVSNIALWMLLTNDDRTVEPGETVEIPAIVDEPIATDDED